MTQQHPLPSNYRPPEQRAAFAAWLNAAMHEARLGPAEVARRYGHSPTIVYQMRKGVHCPREENVDDLSDAVSRPRNQARAILGFSLYSEPAPVAMMQNLGELDAEAERAVKVDELLAALRPQLVLLSARERDMFKIVAEGAVMLLVSA
jgi:hypothetical protein